MKFLKLEHIIANRYNHLLVILLLFILGYPLYDSGERAIGLQIITLTLLAMIIVCLRATIRRRRTFFFCVCIVVTALLMDVLENRIESADLKTTLNTMTVLIYSFFVAFTIAVLMKNMFCAREVTADMIVGGVCIYLLLGILWTLFYSIISIFDQGAITLSNDRSFLYFSLTTLTTLGYGDLVPISEAARVMTNLEAIAGQMYIAVFVARLVGLHIGTQLKRPVE